MSVLDTPEQIAAFRKLTLYRGLRLEVKHGIRMTGKANIPAIIRAEFLPNGSRNKAKLLDEFFDYLTQEGTL